jgi:hypothetical protein
MYLVYLLSSKGKNNFIVSVKMIFSFAQTDMRKDDEYSADLSTGCCWGGPAVKM